MKRLLCALGCAMLALLTAAPSAAQDKKVLFLSKSVSFEHPCVKQVEGKPSHVDTVLTKLAPQFGATITSTKDASQINAENLKKYDLVIFFTQGNLFEAGRDGHPPMTESGLTELLEWVNADGAFMGFHCASDTFHSPETGPATPYIEMVGAEFINHGAQFIGTVKVVDPAHPVMAGFPAELSINDEWYVFRNMNKDKIHVLAVLDPGAEREKQEMYNVPNYPIMWVTERGKGRVFFNGMGHREDVWDNEVFQRKIVNAAHWTMGEGAADAEPNYVQVAGEPGDSKSTGKKDKE